MIEIKDVKKRYKDFTLDCSFGVEAGRITAIIGANGAGKSTLFKAILNLISIDEGSITLFGKEHTKLTNIDKERIGVALSEGGFSGYLKIKSIIPILESVYPKFDKESFKSQCERFQLPMNKKIKELSTGMKAKLKVLIAISHQAELLILDEPTAGLDVLARNELLDMIREYMEVEGRTVLISSHISSDLEGLCDDIYMIHNGKMIFHEDTDVLLDDYGILKLEEAEYNKIDSAAILYVMKEKYGYKCLTNNRQYFTENYPEMVVEKGSIDELITLIVKGEQR